MSLAALLFNRSNSVDLWTQTNIDDVLCHGDRMYLHALTSKMVPDANSLSIEDPELPEVATSQNNVEYRLNYNEFYQGRIDRSFCGDGPFCSLKQVLINAFSDSSNAVLVLDGYVMAVIKKSDFLYLFDSHALLDEINSLLHVALHSVTVTNCSNDQFMNPLLPLYM